ncbi:MAG: deoxyribodipyrimidine photo-lyase [Ignavibacteriales bacterium]|nr:deoxyribodipyrimidine photo-lyase [Ignavibacteriales bacterium]
MVDKRRIKIQKDGEIKSGPIVYWMQRDQRAEDNWALIYSAELAVKSGNELIVVFNLVNDFLLAGLRQYYFMIEGLKETEARLRKLKIPFYLLTGSPGENIPEFVRDVGASLIVSDFNPLKNIRKWKKEVIEKTAIPFHSVDAHNIVPCWESSDKLEFGAYTIRPKIQRKLPEFLCEFPGLPVFHGQKLPDEIKWEYIYESLKVDTSVKKSEYFLPGSEAAEKMFSEFLSAKLAGYEAERNDPNLKGTSDLSPYLHFGQIAAQRVALEVHNNFKSMDSRDSFLEELIIRRELSDNYCFYNKDYDNFNGFHVWAKSTLDEHRKDEREYIYSAEEFERASTHDPLWNAAQREMVVKGKMHGYMRMYWAKKILEWTPSPENAFEIAVFLNDKYQLDGRDPNGYTGIAWSIGGVHDRAWSERPVYGKIRYMNFNGCKRKFDVEKYIKVNS